jgi:hypothetical protein
MPKKRKTTSDAVRILHQRYYEGKPARAAQLADARAADQMGPRSTIRTRSTPKQGSICEMSRLTISGNCETKNSDEKRQSNA